MDIENLILLALSALSTLADDAAEDLGHRVGDSLNDAIESSETQLDDYAKARVLKFLAALTSELSVEGVDE